MSKLKRISCQLLFEEIIFSFPPQAECSDCITRRYVAAQDVPNGFFRAFVIGINDRLDGFDVHRGFRPEDAMPTDALRCVPGFIPFRAVPHAHTIVVNCRVFALRLPQEIRGPRIWIPTWAAETSRTIVSTAVPELEPAHRPRRLRNSATSLVPAKPHIMVAVIFEIIFRHCVSFRRE